LSIGLKMSEAVNQITIKRSVLDETHVSLGALMTEREGWSIPKSYGDALQEYATIREQGAGLIDLSARGRLIVSGSEAVSFLNGLITNDVKTLAENHWMAAAFPNVQGRLIASVRVVRLKDDTTGKSAVPIFLIDTEAATHNTVLKTLQRFTLAGDFRVTDVTDATSLLSVQGKDAARVVRGVVGDAIADVGQNRAEQVEWRNSPVTVVRATHTSEDGFDLLVAGQQAPELWETLSRAGARPVGFDALEVLRIEAGQPRYGIDMNDTNVVSETNLDDAVSFTKGCYIGQEIIARIKYRGHVAKKLTGIVFEGKAEIESGAMLQAGDDKEIGRLTSVTFSPHLARTISLAYVKYDYLAPGTQVKVVIGKENFPGIVSELPFVPKKLI
jgi:aminomethyltransferase